MRFRGRCRQPRTRGLRSPLDADGKAFAVHDVFAAAGVGEMAPRGVAHDHVVGVALAAKMLFVEVGNIRKAVLLACATPAPQSGYSLDPCTQIKDCRSIMSRGRRSRRSRRTVRAKSSRLS